MTVTPIVCWTGLNTCIVDRPSVWSMLYSSVLFEITVMIHLHINFSKDTGNTFEITVNHITGILQL